MGEAGGDKGPRMGVEPVASSRREVLANPRVREARPHRCDGHLEDVLTGLRAEELSWSAWRRRVGLFGQCLGAEPGAEPPRDGPDVL